MRWSDMAAPDQELLPLSSQAASHETGMRWRPEAPAEGQGRGQPASSSSSRLDVPGSVAPLQTGRPALKVVLPRAEEAQPVDAQCRSLSGEAGGLARAALKTASSMSSMASTATLESLGSNFSSMSLEARQLRLSSIEEGSDTTTC